MGGEEAVAADDGHIGEGAPGVAAGGQVLQDAVCRERGISSVMITADLTCRPRGDAATAPVVISSRCHNNCDCTRGNYIAL